MQAHGLDPGSGKKLLRFLYPNQEVKKAMDPRSGSATPHISRALWAFKIDH